MTPAHDEPLEEQAARAQTNSGYARNGTLFPQVYRAAAPPFASKKFAFHGFFFPHRTLGVLRTRGFKLSRVEPRIRRSPPLEKTQFSTSMKEGKREELSAGRQAASYY